MTAQVKEVEAFMSMDGEVFNTYLKAHHRNIYVLAHKLFGVGDEIPDEYQDYKNSAMLLYNLLKADNRLARAAILELAKEIS